MQTSNFVIRGFNPKSMIAMANSLLRIVRLWAEEQRITMSKMQASWITGGYSTWLEEAPAQFGVVTYNEKLGCAPSIAAIRLLGVMFDTQFNFAAHVIHLIEVCEPLLLWLAKLRSTVCAERLSILYRGLILSVVCSKCCCL